MARMERPSAAVLPQSGATSNDSLSVAKSRKHKVVLESVTQEKKKLRQTITFNAKPPLGYTFIPAGNPELTTALKEASRKANAQVFTVTTTPHANVHDLSQQVHRIGYHFSSPVVAEICHQYGVQLSATGQVVGKSYETFLKGYRGRGIPGAEEDGWDQVTLNTKARDAIKDLFPNIPDKDLFQIIKTAFQKGKKRVGTASELPLARRAQLSVVAHIRHCYTAYDRLLRNGGYHDARGVVEKPTLAKLVEWRGDDENGAKVLEDVFREVVVISDNEDSDEEDDDDYDPEAPLKELSVEVVSKQFGTDPRPAPPSGQRRDAGHHGDVYPISDEDLPSTVQFVPRRPEGQHRQERRGLTNHQIWNAAREDFRADPSRQAPMPIQYVNQQSAHVTPTGGSAAHFQPTPSYNSGPSRYEMTAPVQPQYPPVTITGADGTVYTRIESPPRFSNSDGRRLEPQPLPTPYDPLRPQIPAHLQRPPPPLPSRVSVPHPPPDPYARESEIPLPSIEGDSIIIPPARRHGEPSTAGSHAVQRLTPPNYQLPYDVIKLDSSGDRPPAKKRRYDETLGPEQPNYAPDPRTLMVDSRNSGNDQVKRLDRRGYPETLQNEHHRGKDRVNGGYDGSSRGYDPLPIGRNPFERVQDQHPSSSDPYAHYRPHVPDQRHIRDDGYIPRERDDRHLQRPSHNVPLDSRPTAREEVELRDEFNAKFDPSRRIPQRPQEQSPHFDHANVGRANQHDVDYRRFDGSDSRPLPQELYRPTDSRQGQIQYISQYDGIGRAPPRAYERVEPLPQRMEQLAVGPAPPHQHEGIRYVETRPTNGSQPHSEPRRFYQPNYQ